MTETYSRAILSHGHMTKGPLNPAQRVRERIKRWMELARLSQREVASELHKTQPWLDKVLQGQNDVRLRDLDLVAQAMRCTTSELVRTEEDRYVMELTPTEVQIIERLRRRPEVRDALATLLRLPDSPPEDLPKRKGPIQPSRGH